MTREHRPENRTSKGAAVSRFEALKAGVGPFVNTCFFLTGLSLLVHAIPGLMPHLSRLSGALVMAAWTGFYRPFFLAGNRWKIIGLCAAPFAFYAMLHETTVLLGLALLIFLVMHLGRSGEGFERNALATFLLTTVLFFFGSALHRYSALVSHAVQKVSLLATPGITALGLKQHTLGASAVGWPIITVFLCYLVALLYHRPKPVRWRLLLLLLVLMPVCYLVLLGRWEQAFTRFVGRRSWGPFDFQPVLLGLLLLALVPFSVGLHARALPVGWPGVRKRTGWAALLLSGLSVFSLAYVYSGKHAYRTVLFLRHGEDFNVPRYGTPFGHHSIGRFGIVPWYLRHQGYPVAVKNDPVTEADLENAGVVVLFSPTSPCDVAEKQRIYTFIRNGGSLLVVGDHTDLMGIMDPINDLLGPFPIRLNFDTSLPLDSGWRNDLEFRPHPSNAGLRYAHETSIWVGATLELGAGGFPIITGKKGWADIGNPANAQRAFLGDYRRSPDEQLGDVVLVAGCRYGKGKVMVFGDTSSFQNGVIMSTYPYIDNVFTWLSTSPERGWPLAQLALSIVLLGLVVFLGRKHAGGLFLLACLASAHIGLRLGDPERRATAGEGKVSATTGYKICYVDNAHTGRYALSASAGDSLWGLSVNLMRNFYLPLYMNAFDKEKLLAAQMYISVAPTRPYTTGEVEALRTFMERGGQVIWSVGWEEWEASRPFLEAFKLSIDNVPIGDPKLAVAQRQVEFHEAWPVMGGSDRKFIVAQKWEYPLIVFEPVGRGGLLVIGDSHYLKSRNNESYQGYNRNNIVFLKYLIDKMAYETMKYRALLQSPEAEGAEGKAF